MVRHLLILEVKEIEQAQDASLNIEAPMKVIVVLSSYSVYNGEVRCGVAFPSQLGPYLGPHSEDVHKSCRIFYLQQKR